MLLNMETMTTEQKIGMVFCARKWSDEDIEFTEELIKKRALGCIQPPANRPDVIKRLLDAADYPILVFNDTEMGFPTSELPKIPLISLAACDNKEYYRAFAKGIAADAKKADYNGTWGPVLDITSSDGPCRIHRRFSDRADKVGEAAEEIARVYKRNGYLSTGKHYPRGDDSPFDTHMTEGISDATEKEIVEFDLAPYVYLMEKGLLPCIMTAHTVYPSIDPDYPASLSKKVIDIIRNKGFDGVAFTDSLAMMGVLQKYGEENVYGMAVAAGNDVVLPNYRTPTREAFEMLVKNYEDGAFSEERLNEAVRRVLTAQKFVSEQPEDPTEFTEADRQMLSDIAKDCITAITDDGVDVALSGKNEDKLFIISVSMDSESGAKGEISVADWYDARRVAEQIQKDFPGAGIEFLPEYSRQKDNDRVLTAATKYKEVVFVTYCTTTAYLGTDCLTRRTEAVLNSLVHSKKVSAVVHFGNPFALKTIMHVPRKIFGYMISESQRYAIDVLAGKLEAKGTLPYEIEFQ